MCFDLISLFYGLGRTFIRGEVDQVQTCSLSRKHWHWHDGHGSVLWIVQRVQQGLSRKWQQWLAARLDSLIHSSSSSSPWSLLREVGVRGWGVCVLLLDNNMNKNNNEAALPLRSAAIPTRSFGAHCALPHRFSSNTSCYKGVRFVFLRLSLLLFSLDFCTFFFFVFFPSLLSFFPFPFVLHPSPLFTNPFLSLTASPRHLQPISSSFPLHHHCISLILSRPQRSFSLSRTPPLLLPHSTFA